MRRLFSVLFVVFVLAASACTPNTEPQNEAVKKAASHEIYSPKNDIEFRNYNARQVVADDPTTILWCTTSFDNPSSPIFTTPIVGKLTSGNKRPYAIEVRDSGATRYFPELPGPDGMYGTSGEYRYGFTPSGQYVDFYNMTTYCNTEPTVFIRQSTKIVLESDSKLLEAQKAAQAALNRGDKAAAAKLLIDAINAGAPAPSAAPAGKP